MNDQHKTANTPLTPKLEKIRNDLDRVLRDCNLSQQEYNSLMEDMRKRRRRIEGGGDSLFDDLTDE